MASRKELTQTADRLARKAVEMSATSVRMMVFAKSSQEYQQGLEMKGRAMGIGMAVRQIRKLINKKVAVK